MARLQARRGGKERRRGGGVGAGQGADQRAGKAGGRGGRGDARGMGADASGKWPVASVHARQGRGVTGRAHVTGTPWCHKRSPTPLTPPWLPQTTLLLLQVDAVQHALFVARTTGSDKEHMAELEGKLSKAEIELERVRRKTRCEGRGTELDHGWVGMSGA